jgi:alpha-tubulin suppressor-like RCC1 family protein
MKCWGYNRLGQLGDGTTTDHLVPVDVSGLANGVSAVAAGKYHSCAMTAEGGVKCWGFNILGQLGDGTAGDRNVPTDVSGLASGVSGVAAGGDHTCAVMDTVRGGGLKCWGNNGSGQLGNGTTDKHTTPVDVSGLASGVNVIAAGGFYICAVTNGGGLKCWGINIAGQLGDGTTAGHAIPMDVSGLVSGVSAVAAGDSHTCAVTAGGAVKCWGSNGSGQLGDGTTSSRSVPVDVSGLASGVTAVAAGDGHTCAVMDAVHGGAVKCWGSNGFGQLGDARRTCALPR